MILMLDICKEIDAGHFGMYRKKGGTTAFVEFEAFADTEKVSAGNITMLLLPLPSVMEAFPGTSLRPESRNKNSIFLIS